MNRIEFTRAQLPGVIAKAYGLSHPLGMGKLHWQEGPLRQDIVEALLEAGAKYGTIHMDYILGRAVKLAIHRDATGVWWIEDRPEWNDHGHTEWGQLVAHINGVDYVPAV